MTPEISIVIPVFQNQSGLNRCLQAISLQDGIAMSDIEVVVVDNGSEPKIEIDQNLPFSLQLLVCDKKGSYAARNVGALVAKANTIAFLDADCWPAPQWVRSGLDALQKKGEMCFVGGDVRFERSRRPSVVESYQVLMGFGQERSVRELMFAATANLFVSRELFNAVGPFHEGLLSGGDREWSWRAVKLGASLQFSEAALVWTVPRKSLKGALVQARRVAGGRISLEGNDAVVADVGVNRIRPKKGFVDKVKAIMLARQFSIGRRTLILCVAIVIRIVHDVEQLRVRMGGEPERR